VSTRAIQLLKQKRIAHEVVAYDHETKGAEFAAQAVGFPLAQVIKTLVVALDGKTFALALMPGDCQLSLKKMAAACNAKRAAMADTDTAERLTGFLVGGISPFGTKKPLAVVMEQRLLSYKSVMINGGQRGILLKMSPMAIEQTLGAQTADLVQV
jgi:Cys-tRNA(Pro)/Cys-tRNA(Cys) deacylase